MFGYRDEELEARWYQLGAFSPINRLHSNDFAFNGKEPWNYHPEVASAMTAALRLRHAMLPYLYTMNRRAAVEGEPLVQPLYWDYPEVKDAYRVTDEFRFGTELLVSPIVDPADKVAMRAKADVWLPQGEWFDFFDGRRYVSRPADGRRMEVWRDLDRLPVFAKAGAIVPLQAQGDGEALNSVANPQNLQAVVFPGASGSFTLWEDDGAPEAKARWASTELSLTLSGAEESGPTVFRIAPAAGAIDVLPDERSWELVFRGVAPESQDGLTVTVDGRSVEAETSYDWATLSLKVRVPAASPKSGVEVAFPAGLPVADDPLEADAFAVLRDAQMYYLTKENAYKAVQEQGRNALAALGALENLKGVGERESYDSHMPQPVLRALTEVLTRN